MQIVSIAERHLQHLPLESFAESVFASTRGDVMAMIKRIMAALYFSEPSLAAVHYAASFAKDTGAQLLLANILNQRDVDIMNRLASRHHDFPAERYIREHLEDRKKLLDDLAALPVCSGVITESIVKIGVPYKALLEIIHDEKPDLLVRGTVGRSNVVDTIIGSFAAKLFRRSPIPLLSIRQGRLSE